MFLVVKEQTTKTFLTCYNNSKQAPFVIADAPDALYQAYLSKWMQQFSSSNLEKSWLFFHKRCPWHSPTRKSPKEWDQVTLVTVATSSNPLTWEYFYSGTCAQVARMWRCTIQLERQIFIDISPPWTFQCEAMSRASLLFTYSKSIVSKICRIELLQLSSYVWQGMARPWILTFAVWDSAIYNNI